MAKTKVSFDIDKKDLDSVKEIVKIHGITQGEFLRQIVKQGLEEFDNILLNVYVLEDNALVRKSITRSEYVIEMDSSSIAKELVEDFNFLTTGFLIKDGVKTRFYSKVRLS